MLDRSQDTQNSKASISEDLTTLRNVAGAYRRSSSKLIDVTDAKKLTYVPVKSVKGLSKQVPGIRPVRQANTAEEMAVLLTPLITKRFALSNSITKKLRV